MHVETSIDSSNSPAQLETKDTIDEVKYGCLQLLVEVFIKVMNGLVITLEEDKRLLCVWLFYYDLLCDQFCRFANGSVKISIKFYFMRSFFFCLSVFSSSEVLGKITSIRSKRLGKKREETVKPTSGHHRQIIKSILCSLSR